MAIFIVNELESWSFPGYKPAFTFCRATAIYVPPGLVANATAFSASYSDFGTQLTQRVRSMPYTLIKNSVSEVTESQIRVLRSQLLRWWLWLTTTQSSLDRHLHTHWAREVFNKVVWLAGLFNTHRWPNKGRVVKVVLNVILRLVQYHTMSITSKALSTYDIVLFTKVH